MKFLLCFVLCFAAAQASVVGLGGAVTYSAVAPVASVYQTPLAYSSYSAPVLRTYAAPTVYNALQSPVYRSVYAAPAVYAAPSIYTTLLKK